jgi:flagellar basal body-associated protein FliL
MATAALPTDAPPPKKKKGKKLLLIIALLVLIGAATGAGLYFTGMIGAKQEVEQKDMPKLLPKGSKPKVEAKEDGGKSGEAPKYESSYFQLEKEFTSNASSPQKAREICRPAW